MAEKLNLRLSLEKTKITHAHNDRASFLGYHITRGRNPRSTKANNSKESEIHIFMILKSELAKLHSNGMCDSSGYPTSIGKLFCAPADRMIKYGNLKLPFTPIVAEMIRINRRQLPVCRYCFDLAHCGKLEANQIKHSKILLGMESRVQ